MAIRSIGRFRKKDLPQPIDIAFVVPDYDSLTRPFAFDPSSPA